MTAPCKFAYLGRVMRETRRSVRKFWLSLSILDGLVVKKNTINHYSATIQPLLTMTNHCTNHQAPLNHSTWLLSQDLPRSSLAVHGFQGDLRTVAKHRPKSPTTTKQNSMCMSCISYIKYMYIYIYIHMCIYIYISCLSFLCLGDRILWQPLCFGPRLGTPPHG